MKITILGCSSAYGVPMCFNNWDAANPNHPRNQRLRPSLLLELENCKIIIDSGPDFRQQVNRANLSDLDAALLSHGHYDHIGGVPELWRCSALLGHKIKIFGNSQTFEELRTAYGYLFNNSPEQGSKGLEWQELNFEENFEFKGHQFQTFSVPHHKLQTTCLRYQNFAYVPDLHDLPTTAKAHLKNLDLLIIECCNGDKPEANGHSDIFKILPWLEELKPTRTILTHLSARVDYETLKAILPPNVELAYDEMEIIYD